MAVTSGSPVSSANVNSAFVSKTATTSETMVGVLDLNNGSSGTRVTNAQQEINNLKADMCGEQSLLQALQRREQSLLLRHTPNNTFGYKVMVGQKVPMPPFLLELVQ